jgi:acetylglutamate synthase
MREENPRVFWRSRHANVVNDFYFSESDGSYRLNGWKVFWFGFSAFDDIARCVEHCRTHVPTLLDAPAKSVEVAA